MEFYWLEKSIIVPVKRICRGLAVRLGLRKRGILVLRQEVQACEYEDVRIMWEMLNKTDTHEVSHSHSLKWLKNKPVRKALAWARSSTFLSSKFW